MRGVKRITVRTLNSSREFEEIGRLQRQAFGFSDYDAFPTKLITVAHENGGSAVGAFNEEGHLVGFAVNFPGSRYGRIIEWSYLIRVLPAYRGLGLRKRLKLAQREAVLAKGVDMICWGFDPLDTSRARLSFHDLGAVCSEYVADFPDPLNDLRRTAIVDDVLVAVWKLNDERVLARIEADTPEQALQPDAYIIDPSQLNHYQPSAELPVVANRGPVLAIPVPADFEALERDSFSSAESWRQYVRGMLKACLAEGYTIVDIARDPAAPGWSWYVLTRS
jgi:predicted GNAT superfamily acetyltransferase